MAEILAPRCPGCDARPELALDHQYWCGNDGCQVLTWDPTEDAATFKAKATVIDLGAFGNYTGTGLDEEEGK